MNRVGPPLVFEWDPATGALGGTDAEEVRGMAERVRKQGYCLGHPHPTPYVIRNPLRSPSELAVILGNFWRLSDDLEAAYPVPPADNGVPPDALA